MQGVILPPKGHFVMSEDIFDFPNSGQEDAPGISHSLSLFFLSSAKDIVSLLFRERGRERERVREKH